MSTIERTRRAVSTATLWLLAACAAVESDRRAEAGEPLESRSVTTAPAALDTGPWTVTAEDGTRVTLASSRPLSVGANTLEVTAAGGLSVHAVDLISPTMPLHGVMRFPVTTGQVVVSIPMEGRWSLYANLDEVGASAAEFAFDVVADDNHADGHAPHGGEAPATTEPGYVPDTTTPHGG